MRVMRKIFFFVLTVNVLSAQVWAEEAKEVAYGTVIGHVYVTVGSGRSNILRGFSVALLPRTDRVEKDVNKIRSYLSGLNTKLLSDASDFAKVVDTFASSLHLSTEGASVVTRSYLDTCAMLKYAPRLEDYVDSNGVRTTHRGWF